MTCIYVSQLIVLLKNAGRPILFALTAHQTPTFIWWNHTSCVRCGSLNSSSNTFSNLCITASEPMLHQKRMSIGDQSHLQWCTVETNWKNEFRMLFINPDSICIYIRRANFEAGYTFGTMDQTMKVLYVKEGSKLNILERSYIYIYINVFRYWTQRFDC